MPAGLLLRTTRSPTPRPTGPDLAAAAHFDGPLPTSPHDYCRLSIIPSDVAASRLSAGPKARLRTRRFLGEGRQPSASVARCSSASSTSGRPTGPGLPATPPGAEGPTLGPRVRQPSCGRAVVADCTARGVRRWQGATPSVDLTWLRPEKALTVTGYLNQWLEGKTRLKPSPGTGYQQHLNLYLKPALGHLRLADLRDVDLQALYAAMRLIGRPAGDSGPSPVARRLLEARTDTPAARRPLSGATIRRVHATAMSSCRAR